MHLALEEAQKAVMRGEVPIGCVIVDATTGEVIAAAHNEVESKPCASAHAELLAIERACTTLGDARLPGCDLYVTLEPCPMCAQAISFARLRRVYFGAYDPKGGGVDHGPRIFESSSCLHKPEVMGGIEEEACSKILVDFFKILRIEEVKR